MRIASPTTANERNQKHQTRYLKEFTRGSAMAAADASEKLALIRENLAEILNPEIIEKILDEGRHPKIYWGMFGLDRWETRCLM